MSDMTQTVVPIWAGDEVRADLARFRARTAAIREVKHRPRVLVLEDEYVEAAVFARMIQDIAHPVIQTDPRQALSLVFDGPRSGIWFDAAIVDVMLPHMSGLEFVERLHTLSEKRIPVVLLSGVCGLGVDFQGEFLEKPVGKADLVAALQRCAPRIGPTSNGSAT